MLSETILKTLLLLSLEQLHLLNKNHSNSPQLLDLPNRTMNLEFDPSLFLMKLFLRRRNQQRRIIIPDRAVHFLLLVHRVNLKFNRLRLLNNNNSNRKILAARGFGTPLPTSWHLASVVQVKEVTAPPSTTETILSLK